MTNNLKPYSKICVPCAKALGGEAAKEQLWFNQLKCEICNKETGCVSAKDYGVMRIIRIKEELKESIKDIFQRSSKVQFESELDFIKRTTKIETLEENQEILDEKL